MDYIVQQYIQKLSKKYNYFDNMKAIKIIANMSEEQAREVLLNEKVQKTIFKIDEINTLKEVFRLSPAFFQEVMFSNEAVQDLLISPRKSLTRKELINNYDKKDFIFTNEEIKKLNLSSVQLRVLKFMKIL